MITKAVLMTEQFLLRTVVLACSTPATQTQRIMRVLSFCQRGVVIVIAIVTIIFKQK